ncbi:MAG: SpoIIE family protein phosphatase [Acidobacteria bacterium]|nr:SpoIIE family protein phosphatase [Acidobacteriota bacterium]
MGRTTSPTIRRQTARVEWAVSEAPFPGKSESGDSYVVKPVPGGVLVAVIDGLGHGGEAAVASRIAVNTLERHAGESVISLLQRCHVNLKNSRGAAMNLASFSSLDHTMTWLGVGNVEGLLLRRDPAGVLQQERILLRPGVVGFQLPELRAMVVPVSLGDILVFATDGIRRDFAENISMNTEPQSIADQICTAYRLETDDSLVLVVRYAES